MPDCFDIAGKTGGGVIGFISSKMLADINGMLSAVVALFTIVWLGISISKKISDWRKGN